MSTTTIKALPVLAAALLAGCTNLFLQPDRGLHLRPEKVGAVWEEAKFSSADGTALTGLWFAARPGPAKGVLAHFHGNAENMTSHFLFVHWLALEGWDVLVFDYRGYGASGGTKSLAGAVEDGAAALALARARAAGRPLVVLGQSLGGALAVASLARDGGAGVSALVLDSSFDSYRLVARSKLAQPWLTRPLRWPLSFLFSERFAPVRLAAARPPMPLLMMHAPGDPVVPYERGRALYDAASGPKEFWDIPGGGHTDALGRFGAEYRPRLARWLNALTSRERVVSPAPVPAP